MASATLVLPVRRRTRIVVQLANLVRHENKRVPEGTLFFLWRPQGESNPCRRRERAVS